MASIPYHVAQSFLAKKKDSAGAFTTDGQQIKSYNLTLAYWRHGGEAENDYVVVAHDLNNKISATTARHISALKACLPATAVKDD